MIFFFFALITLSGTAVATIAEPAPLARHELVNRIVNAGVPRRGIERILDFQDQNVGVPFVTDIYYCAGGAPTNARACQEKQRIFTTKTVVVTEHEYAVYIDFKTPSNLKRFWLINLRDGTAESQLVSHGAGSGNGADPQRFGNRRNSRMTSLGMYMAGDTYYSGKHGLTLRLHGLERSNNNAYIRDIVFHGARYASEEYLLQKQLALDEFIEDKIGESWGCPAVNEAFALKVIPLLKNGALFFLDHADLLESSMTGEEVSLPLPAIP